MTSKANAPIACRNCGIEYVVTGSARRYPECPSCGELAVSSESPLHAILDATWRDGAQLASPLYLQDSNGNPLPTMRIDQATTAITTALLERIGPNEPVDGYSKDPNRSIRPAARNELRCQLRKAVMDWAGGDCQLVRTRCGLVVRTPITKKRKVIGRDWGER